MKTNLFYHSGLSLISCILESITILNFQSAYKAGHNYETALLRVYNDIVTTIGRGNGAMLVLLDLSAAFDTIDHDNLVFVFLRNM